MAANYQHIGGGENRLGRHYSRFSAFWPPAALADQSLALRKSQNAGSNRRSRVKAGVATACRRTILHAARPLVYFEEWDEPMISGIGWVSELIEIAGGIDIFADRSAGKSAMERIVTAEEIIARRPDIIIGSWCGKKFRPEKLAARPGFEQIPAVRNRALYEIKSPIILQPGPAALTDGLRALQAIIKQAGQAITAM